MSSGQLYFEVRGRGSPLLFIGCASADPRTTPLGLTAPLLESASVITYDHRGVGRSTAGISSFSTASHAADAAGLIRCLGHKCVDVVGFSFGGLVAQELAIRYPSLVRRLVLVASSSGGAGGSLRTALELETVPLRHRADRHLQLADRRYSPNDRRRVRWAHLWQYLHSGHCDTSPARRLMHIAAAEHDTWNRIAVVSCPTLVAGGRYDDIAPPMNQASLASRIRLATLRLFDAGHLLLLQDGTAHESIINHLAKTDAVVGDAGAAS
jgi:3-oxoadipate enol-lactonase